MRRRGKVLQALLIRDFRVDFEGGQQHYFERNVRMVYVAFIELVGGGLHIKVKLIRRTLIVSAAT